MKKNEGSKVGEIEETVKKHVRCVKSRNPEMYVIEKSDLVRRESFGEQRSLLKTDVSL